MKCETRYISPLGVDIEFKIGRDAADNFNIIESSQKNDIWFHIDQHSSCHVIASMPEDINYTKKQLMYIIKQGAILCKQHSKYKSQKDVSIIYTYIKNITMTNIIGSVITEFSKTIKI